MVNEIRVRIYELSDNFNKEIGNIKIEIESIKNNQSEMENTITEMKNTLLSIHSRVGETDSNQ